MNIQELKSYWYAYIYEEQENQSDDVDFFLLNIGTNPKKIIEIACGGGRILIPLANQGHNITGLDIDKHMLERCMVKTQGMSNVTCYLTDVMTHSWGNNNEIVLLAGNILLNIESAMDYAQSQQILLKKAFDCLSHGGYLYLDFGNSDSWQSFSMDTERTFFEGKDDHGTYGKFGHLSNEFNSSTRFINTTMKTEIITQTGEKVIDVQTRTKYFPTSGEVLEWLTAIGFTTDKVFGDFDGGPLSMDSPRVIVIARKQ